MLYIQICLFSYKVIVVAPFEMGMESTFPLNVTTVSHNVVCVIGMLSIIKATRIKLNVTGDSK